MGNGDGDESPYRDSFAKSQGNHLGSHETP